MNTTLGLLFMSGAIFLATSTAQFQPPDIRAAESPQPRR
jgi:hypothetical protein